MKIGFTAILFLIVSNIYSQGRYLLIRSDDNQSFYIRIGEQTYNSTPTGNLSIPVNQDNSLTIIVGFPENRFPEQKFTVALKTGENNFLLKRTDSKGWQLDDDEGAKKLALNPAGVKKDDAFSRLMAGVVNDTAVMYNTAPPEEPKRDTVKASLVKTDVKKDTPLVVIDPAKNINTASVSKKPGLVKPVKKGLKTPAVSDSTKLVAIKAPPKKDSSLVASKKITPAITTKKPVVDSAVVKEDESALPAGIYRIYEKKLGPGLKLIYADISEKEVLDSIDIYIEYEKPGAAKKELVQKPIENPVIKQEEKNIDTAGKKPPIAGLKTDSLAEKKAVPEKPAVAKTSAPVLKQEEKNADTASKKISAGIVKADSLVQKNGQTEKTIVAKAPPKIIATLPKKEEKKADSVSNAVAMGSVKQDSAGEKKVKTEKIVINSDCKVMATEYDEDKLRVKMMAQPNDDDKVIEARKFFKLKCYSVKQLRNLSEVFPKDEGRYKFFDAAYPYVSDFSSFSQLQDLLIDPYYINRFKAMIKN